MTTLGTVTARTAYLIRCIAIAYIGVQVLIWHSFYAAAPWRLAGPLAAVAWGGVVVAYLLRRRPGWALASLIPAFRLPWRSAPRCGFRPRCAAIRPTWCTSSWRDSS